MDGVSADPEQKKFQSAHQLCFSTMKSCFRNLDIPPRKLLTRRLAALSSEPSMEMYHHYNQHQQIESPRVPPEETLFQKFLGNSAIDDGSDSYASDEFRMYEFKIRKCTRSRSHDWTDCPFAHPGEKARRRCPRRFSYSGTVCADFRRGSCIRGDGCEFAHGVFECWLHPSRYRTEACKDGKNCQRKICFFAHTASQLRSQPPTEMVDSSKKHGFGRCAYCHCQPSIRHTTSPTSILDPEKLSPASSPPISPAQTGGGFSPISRLVRMESCGIPRHGNPGSSYKEARNELMTPQAIEELMHNMKVMNMNSINEAPNSNPMWLGSLAACDDDQQSFFSVSPSKPFPASMNNLNGDRVVNQTPITGPDVKWLNDLLT